MNTTGGLPLIDFSNYNDLGTRNFRPQYQNPHHWQFLDTLTMAFGVHSLRAGVEMRLKNNELVDITRRTPAYTLHRPGHRRGYCGSPARVAAIAQRDDVPSSSGGSRRIRVSCRTTGRSAAI